MTGDFQSGERRTSRLAARQHGHVTRQQLLALELAPSRIDSWIRHGRLIRIHQGVYALGYRRVEPVALAAAAVLACGDGALLSHDSTLALHGLRRWPPTCEVTVDGDRRRPGIRVHRSITLTRADRSLWLGVPTSRVARAIADMGHRLTDAQRIRLTNDARLRKLLTVEEQLVLLHHDRNPTRSGGEDALQRWIDDHDLPQPNINTRVNGHEVDAEWPRQKVVLQLDHLATHSDPHTFSEDRRHDREDLGVGYVTVRLLREDLTAAEAARMRRLLHAREPRRDPRAC